MKFFKKVSESKNKLMYPERFHRIKSRYFSTATGLALMILFLPSAFATNDALTAINNMSTFVFAAIKAIGIILLGWGVVQIGLSLQSHDPSQRSNGFLTFFGGLVIAFAKEILDAVLA